MSDMRDALAAAEADVALWSEVEREWRTPKGCMTAHFMRARANDEREAAERTVASIKAAIAASTPNDEAGIKPASQPSTPNDE